MNIASIDIGTNTILLLIAEVDSSGINNILEDQQVIARLGKGVDAERNILPETFHRVKDFLIEYKSLCLRYNVEKILAVGTSALRDARNAKEFCSYIKKETDLNIEILSGDDEALWTFRGSIPKTTNSSELFSVVDIGGGSTEITIGTSQSISSAVSIDIGSVRLTERFFFESPPGEEAIMQSWQFILEQLHQKDLSILKQTTILGVAGTITTLAAVDLDIPEFDREKIEGYTLSAEAVRRIFSELKNKSHEQILHYPQILPGRADVILAGIMIIMGIMEIAAIPSITVSVKGLRYGIMLRELEQR